jgi:hypothetical protein
MLMLLAILVCVALVFGACLAWIVGAIADADIEVGQAASAVVMTLISTFFLVFLLRYAVGAPEWVLTVSSALLSWLILAALVVSYAKVSWKHGFIISAIYAVAQSTVFIVMDTVVRAA